MSEQIPSSDELIAAKWEELALYKLQLKQERDVDRRCDLHVKIGHCTQEIRRAELRMSGGY